jgi:Type II secretion system (T2SS), protein E, N-terminal domain
VTARPEDEALAIAASAGLRFVGLRDHRPGDEFDDLLPLGTARELRVVPLAIDGDVVQVASADPDPDLRALHERLGGRRVEVAIARRDELDAVLGPPPRSPAPGATAQGGPAATPLPPAAPATTAPAPAAHPTTPPATAAPATTAPATAARSRRLRRRLLVVLLVVLLAAAVAAVVILAARGSDDPARAPTATRAPAPAQVLTTVAVGRGS